MKGAKIAGCHTKIQVQYLHYISHFEACMPPLDTQQACTRKHCEVSEDQLPLCCPMPDQALWDAHPRVYLPIEQTGRVVCPYCETEYRLRK